MTDNQSVMILTEQEWQDLAVVCRHFCDVTSWVQDPRRREGASAEYVDGMFRQRELCHRVMDATDKPF